MTDFDETFGDDYEVVRMSPCIPVAFMLVLLFCAGMIVRDRVPVGSSAMAAPVTVIVDREEAIELPELWSDAATSRLSERLQGVVQQAVHDAFAPITTALDRANPNLAAQLPATAPPPPSFAATADDQDRVVEKGCKCRHKLAVGKAGWTGWAMRTWHTVSFEDWQWAQVGDRWPLPAPESRPVR